MGVMILVFTICLAIFFASTHVVKCTVTTAEFPQCKEFFYKNMPPTGFTSNNYRAICQLYHSAYRFATLYDVWNRIPVYSAYRLDRDDFDCGPNQPARRGAWFIEPQLSTLPSTSPGSMTTSGGAAGNDLYEPYQALNKDYNKSGYDRGHLNPCLYNCYDDRVATFTLTNAVPQNPTFNRIQWKRQEALAKSKMKTHCPTGKKSYFVTGATPSTGNSITNIANRVNVPSELWTAACCDTGNSNTDFSFAFVGKNMANGRVIPGPVHAIEANLGVNIFKGGCGSTSFKSTSVINELDNELIG